MIRFLYALIVACGCLCAASPAVAQFGEQPSTGGPVLGSERIQRWKVGMVVTARTPCVNVFGTLPVPTDWPEQDVRVVEEQISTTIHQVRYRDLEDGGIRQMLVTVPQLAAGETAEAIVTVEVTRRAVDLPTDPATYQVPKRVPRDVRKYLADSPLINSHDRKVRDVAKEVTADKGTAWEKVEAIQAWVKENIKHTNDKFKGTDKTLTEKGGHIEDLTGLFIAMCRAQKIPARTVWVPDYCYAEFYLEDAGGHGYWFPCELKEKTVFGTVSADYVIMQKGDNIRVPEKKDKPYRLVPEYVEGKGTPSVSFVRQIVQ